MKTFLLILFSFPVWALPCLNKIPALPFTGVSVFQDCDKDSLLYFVPQDLTIRQQSFSGKKAFQYRLMPDGTARVLMRFHLLVDDALVARTVRALKRDVPLPYRFKAFNIKDVQLTGFDTVDGVSAQTITADGQFSDSLFSLQLTLTPEGAKLWKESAENDFWTVQAASLKYQLQAVNDGVPEWRSQSHAISISSLPSCAILGKDCTEDIKKRLATRGADFGRRYFHDQFVQCSDFATKTFQAPTLLEVGDDSLEDVERETVHLFAKKGYEEELRSLKDECGTEIDFLAGKDWFAAFATEKGIKCSNLSSWGWAKVKDFVSGRPPKFVDGALKAHQELVTKCGQVDGEWACDQRNGDTKCPAEVKDGKLCFNPQIIKDNVTFEGGSCTFSGFLKKELGSLFGGLKTVSTKDAKQVETCVTLSESVSAPSQVYAKVSCKNS